MGMKILVKIPHLSTILLKFNLKFEFFYILYLKIFLNLNAIKTYSITYEATITYLRTPEMLFA